MISIHFLAPRAETMAGVFFSDLHLFSRRSIGQQCWNDARKQVSDTRLLVLGGDIFDFRWSQHGSFDQSLTMAATWLRSVLDDFPGLQVAYILGNHDCHPEMQALLSKLSLEQSRFTWHEYQFRLGKHLFLHGDELDAGSFSELPRYRSRFHENHVRGKFTNTLYDAAVQARLHIAIPSLRHRPLQTCERLAASLKSRSLGLSEGIEQIYFGHTHQMIDRLLLRGQAFHNPGGAIKHGRFAHVPFALPEDWQMSIYPSTSDRLGG